MNIMVHLLILFAPGANAGIESSMPGWLAGCWEQRAGDRVYEEQWMAPAGGIMPGMSRMLLDEELAGFEYLRIELDGGSGRLQYVALPSGQAMTVFPLVSSQDRRLVFENPAHDFPQRIIYSLHEERLDARIEGMQGEEMRSLDFRMRRVACSG